VGVGIHHLALDPTTETLYVANASSHTVSVVDVSTGQVIATVAVGSPSTVYFSPDGPGPGAIAVDPVTHQVYVADMGGHTVTVLQGVPTAVPNAPAMPDTGAGGGRWLQQPVQAPTNHHFISVRWQRGIMLYHCQHRPDPGHLAGRLPQGDHHRPGCPWGAAHRRESGSAGQPLIPPERTQPAQLGALPELAVQRQLHQRLRAGVSVSWLRLPLPHRMELAHPVNNRENTPCH